MNVVPIPATPIVLVLEPLPVISAHLSVPRSPQVDPVGIEAGPCPPQSTSISPSLDDDTNPLSLSNMSPLSSFVVVVVVVVTVVVSISVIPVESLLDSVITSVSINSITVGVQSPTVIFVQSGLSAISSVL